MPRLVIFGSGGFAREVLQVALDLNEAGAEWEVLGFLDDDHRLHGEQIHGLPILGGVEWLEGRDDVQAAIGIGGTAVRRKVARKLDEARVRSATLIHPRAWVGRKVKVGEGSVVCADCLLTTDITLGRHVILNLDCTVGHDAVLQDFITVAPSVNISGNVTVGEGCDLGTGSTIIQGIDIGEWSIVGAGAIVVQDLPANVTAVGGPAKPIKVRPAGWHE